MALPRLSFLNLLACTDVTSCATAQACSFCSSNAREPERPFIPWRTTTSTAAQAVVFDFGAAQALDLIFVNRTNASCALRIQGNATSAWGAPSYDSQNVAVTRNPFTGRVQYLHCSTGFNLRYLRVLVPSQDKILEHETDTAVEYFLVGGVWAGLSTTPPTHLKLPVEVHVDEPRSDIGPSHGGWEQRLDLGEPRAVLEARRLVTVTARTPGLSDELRTAACQDRLMRDRDVFLWDMNLTDPSQAWVVRRRSGSLWKLDGARSEGPIELSEVIGP